MSDLSIYTPALRHFSALRLEFEDGNRMATDFDARG
jgi:hypothetical protein